MSTFQVGVVEYMRKIDPLLADVLALVSVDEVRYEEACEEWRIIHTKWNADAKSARAWALREIDGLKGEWGYQRVKGFWGNTCQHPVRLQVTSERKDAVMRSWGFMEQCEMTAFPRWVYPDKPSEPSPYVRLRRVCHELNTLSCRLNNLPTGAIYTGGSTEMKLVAEAIEMTEETNPCIFSHV